MIMIGIVDYLWTAQQIGMREITLMIAQSFIVSYCGATKSRPKFWSTDLIKQNNNLATLLC